MIRGAFVLLCSAAAIAGAGCGEDRINTARVEDEVERAVERQVGLPVAGVACPKDVAIEEGGRFECTVSGENGGEAKVRVVQTDGEGNIRFRVPDVDALRAPASPGQ